MSAMWCKRRESVETDSGRWQVCCVQKRRARAQVEVRTRERDPGSVIGMKMCQQEYSGRALTLNCERIRAPAPRTFFTFASKAAAEVFLHQEPNGATAHLFCDGRFFSGKPGADVPTRTTQDRVFVWGRHTARPIRRRGRSSSSRTLRRAATRECGRVWWLSLGNPHCPATHRSHHPSAFTGTVCAADRPVHSSAAHAAIGRCVAGRWPG